LTYRNNFPKSLEGFPAAFLSFGNSGSGNTPLNDQMASVLIDYLQGGGYVYLEGGDALGHDQSANTQLINLFGLAAASDGTGDNPINSLEGKPAAITNGMVFIGNSQLSNASIDKYAQSSNGIVAFIESGYGTVAVQQSIPNSRRTFCFSYSLANLTDNEYPNSREELLHRIMNFFDIFTATPEIEMPVTTGCKVYPNPFGESTIFEYELEENQSVTLTIFNHIGQQVVMLLNENQTKGRHLVQWDAVGLPVGIYFYRISAIGNWQSAIGKIIKY